MSKPGPALAFCIRHGADVAVLWERESPPEGVTTEDWAKFERVLAMATEEGVELVSACRGAIVAGLGDACVASRGASRQRIADNWDAWCEIKPPGQGKMFGWVGACFGLFDDGGGWLIGYARPASTNGNLREGLNAKPSVGMPAFTFTPETAIIFEARVTAETTLDTVVRSCGDQFAKRRGALKEYMKASLPRAR